jgi:hypothetical protein
MSTALRSKDLRHILTLVGVYSYPSPVRRNTPLLAELAAEVGRYSYINKKIGEVPRDFLN